MALAIAGKDPLRRRATGFAIATAAGICLWLPSSGHATVAGAGACPSGQIRTSSGCTTFAGARSRIESIVEQTAEEDDLRAALVRVDIGNSTLARIATGESMAGVPASLRMHFRIGSIAIPYLIDVLLQLQDQGRLSLDDPVSNWLPDLPNADEVTLRMLGSATSGYQDWIQGNEDFVNTLYANPFRQWTTQELLDIALARPLACDPGACFHYSHTGFAILSRVIHEVTGQQTATLMRRRILGPLGLRQTQISALPEVPHPILHAYTADRGPYEDSTFWSPSWTIAKSTIMTSTIGDMIKSAKALGTGALISPQASDERFSPATTAGFPGFSDDLYFGLGVVVANTWQFQNPELNGSTAIMAYLPSRRISLALTVTKGQSAAQTSTNFSQLLWAELADYLAPNHPPTLPG